MLFSVSRFAGCSVCKAQAEENYKRNLKILTSLGEHLSKPGKLDKAASFLLVGSLGFWAWVQHLHPKIRLPKKRHGVNTH